MKKKKLLILGASGFIGKNLAIFFSKKKDFQVTGTYFHKKTFIKNVKVVQCNLTKKKETDKIIRGMDIIIQAAATTSGAKDILAKPYIHVNDNAIINSMVTRSAYDCSVKHVLVFSCSVMYKSSKKLLKETDFNPNENMYKHYFGAGWMKVFVEKMCEFYSRLGRNKYTLIRHSNTYGPYDKFGLEKSHVLAASINKVINCKGKRITIWGNGKEKRDLLFVSDLINFVDLAIKKQKNKYALYNVGSGKLISINELIKKIIKISGKKIVHTNDLTKKTLQTSICLNCYKAKKELEWFPKVSLKDGIKRTIDWYFKNKSIY